MLGCNIDPISYVSNETGSILDQLKNVYVHNTYDSFPYLTSLIGASLEAKHTGTIRGTKEMPFFP